MMAIEIANWMWQFPNAGPLATVIPIYPVLAYRVITFLLLSYIVACGVRYNIIVCDDVVT